MPIRLLRFAQSLRAASAPPWRGSSSFFCQRGSLRPGEWGYLPLAVILHLHSILDLVVAGAINFVGQHSCARTPPKWKIPERLGFAFQGFSLYLQAHRQAAKSSGPDYFERVSPRWPPKGITMNTFGESWGWPDEVFILFLALTAAFCQELDALRRGDEDEVFAFKLWVPCELADLIASLDSFRTDRRGMRCTLWQCLAC